MCRFSSLLFPIYYYSLKLLQQRLFNETISIKCKIDRIAHISVARTHSGEQSTRTSRSSSWNDHLFLFVSLSGLCANTHSARVGPHRYVMLLCFVYSFCVCISRCRSEEEEERRARTKNRPNCNRLLCVMSHNVSMGLWVSFECIWWLLSVAIANVWRKEEEKIDEEQQWSIVYHVGPSLHNFFFYFLQKSFLFGTNPLNFLQKFFF